MRAATAMLAGLALVVGCATGDDEPAGAPATDPSTTTTAPPAPRPGAPGIGDPLFPTAGNGGYDVGSYDLRFDMTAPDGTVIGVTRIDATATQGLSSFHLDFRGYGIDDVSLDGEAVPHRRQGDELVVAPETALAEGDEFTVEVRYRGIPPGFTEPTGPIPIGWLRAPTGSFTVHEPIGARTMFPGNDHPADKAEVTMEVRVPDGTSVVASGEETSRRDDGAAEVVTFTVDEPVAPYLVQLAVGDYEIVEVAGPDGVTLRSATVPGAAVDATELNDSAARQIPWMAERFGPYPFDTYGLLVADAPPSLALETQTLSIFPASWFSAGLGPIESIAAHELAHQWFGDHVALERWSDMWLKEGLATYVQWMWEDHTGFLDLSDRVANALFDAPRWRREFGPVGAPEVAGLYSDNTYDGGALVFHALRRKVGDDTFFGILRRWVETYGGGSASAADFEALAAEESGQELGAFFDGWVRSTTVPDLTP